MCSHSMINSRGICEIFRCDVRDLIKQGDTMTAKHTPGPWKVIETLGNTAIIFGTPKSIGLAPNTVTHIWPHVEKGDPKANAALIAAAPELLEALKDLISGAESLCASGDAKTYPAGFRQAIETVSKAEGRA